jgi:prophage antirepressor-like protein
MNRSSTDSPNNNRYITDFEGRLTIVEVEGRLAVIGHSLGELLGYADGGKQLVGLVSKEWSDEFIDGADVITLRGERLAAFKAACKQLGLDLVDKRAPSLMLLTMSGVQLVLARSEKPEGKAFRRWLVTEVIPAYESAKQLAGEAAPQLEKGAAPGGQAAAPGNDPAGPGRRTARGRPSMSRGGASGGPPRPPGGRPPGAQALPDPDRGAIWCRPAETAEEKLAAAHARGQELPRAANADELVRGQVLRLVRCTGQRGPLLEVLERLGGARAPAVSGATHAWQVELTQAAWLVRRLSAGLLVAARDEVGRLILEHDPRDHQMVSTLVALITVELCSLPEGVLAEVLAAVPRWRSGMERPIPLPVSV